MAINFDQLRDAVAPAKATPRVDYSPWAKGSNESLLAYYKRLAAQREGGILGTRGLMDRPTVEKGGAAKEDKEVKGTVNVSASTGKSEDTSSSSYDRDGDGVVTETERKSVDLQGSVDRLSDRGFLPGDLHWLLSPLNSSVTDSDEARVVESMRNSGMADNEIERILKDTQSDGGILGSGLMEGQKMERLAAFHGMGLLDQAATDDYVPGQGKLGKIGSAVAGLFAGTNYGGPVSNAVMKGTYGEDFGSLRNGEGQEGPDGRYAATPSFDKYRNYDETTDTGRFGEYTPRYDFNPSSFSASYNPYAMQQKEAQAQAEVARQAQMQTAQDNLASLRSQLAEQTAAAQAAQTAQAQAAAEAAAAQTAEEIVMSAPVVQSTGGSGSLLTGSSTSGSGSDYAGSTSYGTDYSANTGSNFDVSDFTSDSKVISSHGSSGASSGGSSGGGKWLCSKMHHMGKWTRKEALQTYKWHNAQPDVWKRGYDVWGKFLARKVLKNDFWAKVMQEWTDNTVKGGKLTWRAMLGKAVIAPCWVVGVFNRKPVGEFTIAKKEEVM